MNFTVYSKEGCGHCERIKTVLRLTGCTFVVYNLDEEVPVIINGIFFQLNTETWRSLKK